MRNVIKKAVISEKSFQDAVVNKFAFIVDKTADKETVAKAIENLFSVTVLSVNIMNYIGKVKMTKRNRGKRSDYKKAIVELKPGQKIDLFELETAEKPENPVKETKKSKKEIKESKDVEVKIKEKKK